MSYLDLKKWDCTQQIFPTGEVMSSILVEEQNGLCTKNIYGHLKNVSCDIPKEICAKKDCSKNTYQNSALMSPEVHSISTDNSWQKQFVDDPWQNQYINNSLQEKFSISNQVFKIVCTFISN